MLDSRAPGDHRCAISESHIVYDKSWQVQRIPQGEFGVAQDLKWPTKPISQFPLVFSGLDIACEGFGAWGQQFLMATPQIEINLSTLLESLHKSGHLPPGRAETSSS
jgi:hypothetical protein